MDKREKEIYQELILEHNRTPRNFRAIPEATHKAEGYNPLCGDHLQVYLKVDNENIIEDIAFEGDGCAISRASASLMTSALKGKTVSEAEKIFSEFHDLLLGQLTDRPAGSHLGKLITFSGIWQYPARVKCASLAWHAFKAAIEKKENVSTE